MHPVLTEIPLPRWNVALTPWLAVLSLFAFAACVLGHRARRPDLFWLGLAGGAAALAGALMHRGHRIEIGPLPVYSFGAFLSCAVLAGWLTTLRCARREGIPDGATVAACLAATVAGFVGARLLYVVTNVRDFGSVADAIAFQNGGLTAYGALVSGAGGSVWALRRRHVRWLAFGDAAAPGLALGSCIGRLGCYLAGCDYGTPLGARAPAWLKRLGTFPRWPDDVAGAAAGSPVWLDHVIRRGLPLARRESLPVHPTELYEAVLSLLLFALLIALRARRRFVGELVLVFVAGYAVLRFVVELVRGDPERGLWGPLSTTQWFAVASSISVAVAASYRSRLKRAGALPAVR